VVAELWQGGGPTALRCGTEKRRVVTIQWVVVVHKMFLFNFHFLILSIEIFKCHMSSIRRKTGGNGG
jgi:hypothetical protein